MANCIIPLKTYLNNAIEASESSYLYIETSQLPNSGKGLHTMIPIYKDEIIALFKGEILTESMAAMRANKNQDQYFIKMLDGRIMDSKKVKCFAKYANDVNGSIKTVNGLKNNARISLDDNENICLVATRKIKSGEEIFCSYGKQYWLKHQSSIQK